MNYEVSKAQSAIMVAVERGLKKMFHRYTRSSSCHLGQVMDYRSSCRMTALPEGTCSGSPRARAGYLHDRNSDT